MFRGTRIVVTLLLALLIAEPASAGLSFDIRIPLAPRMFTAQSRPRQNQDQGQSQLPIAPSEAAAIAQDQVPGSTVVGVKLLPGGRYAVTLRTESSVTRVIVDGQDGSTN